MYASPVPFARPGLGAVPPPVATVGGKHVCEMGVHYVTADDTGKRWRLERSLSLKDGDCSLTRIKVRGAMTGPDSIKVSGWGRMAAGEQALTTIVGGGGDVEAAGAPTDTIEANLRAVEQGDSPLFVGLNTRSLVEQAATWDEAQAATFAELRAPATQALEDYLASAGVEGEEAAAFLAEGTPGREAWSPDVVPTWDEMYGHLPAAARGPDAPPLRAEASGFIEDLPPWALMAGAGLVAVLVMRRGAK